MLRRLSLVALAVVALLAGPGVASSATASNGSPGHHGKSPCQRQFDQTVIDFDEAFLAKDLDKFISFYHKNATVVTTGGAVRSTRAEIEAGFSALFNTDFIATFSTIRQVVDGCATGVVVSDFVIEIPSVNLRVHFVNTITFIRDRGRWQAFMDQSTPLPA